MQGVAGEGLHTNDKMFHSLLYVKNESCWCKRYSRIFIILVIKSVMAITTSLDITASWLSNLQLLSFEADVIGLIRLVFLLHSYAEVSTGYLVKEYRYLQLISNNLVLLTSSYKSCSVGKFCNEFLFRAHVAIFYHGILLCKIFFCLSKCWVFAGIVAYSAVLSDEKSLQLIFTN